MKILYRIYQFLIVLPLFLADTVVMASLVVVFSLLGCPKLAHFFGKTWAWIPCRLLLLPVRVRGREHLEKGTSYVFVANHQGAMDIFLVYGFLGREFKWMMKKELRKVPFIGLACERSNHIFVDRKNPRSMPHTMQQAARVLRGGCSLMVFPEGSRTWDGTVGWFKRGAFLLAQELQLPVVPVTIDGSFRALPRSRGMFNFVDFTPLTLTFHQPVMPPARDADSDALKQVMDNVRQAIVSPQA